MAEETQYTANTGFTTITTANSNLNGSGAMETVLTAGSNGTLIKTITITSVSTCKEGMIRLFIDNGNDNWLLKEVEVTATDVSSSLNPKFEVHIPLDFALQAGYSLKASTQSTDNFYVIAEGLDWTYYATSVRTDTTQYTANTGLCILNTGGTGVAALTAGENGCSIESITVKAIESPSDGFIDIYISDGASAFALYSQIKVDATTRSGIASSFEYNYIFENDFELKSGYILALVTRQSQLFSVVAEGLNWAYPA